MTENLRLEVIQSMLRRFVLSLFVPVFAISLVCPQSSAQGAPTDKGPQKEAAEAPAKQSEKSAKSSEDQVYQGAAELLDRLKLAIDRRKAEMRTLVGKDCVRALGDEGCEGVQGQYGHLTQKAVDTAFAVPLERLAQARKSLDDAHQALLQKKLTREEFLERAYREAENAPDVDWTGKAPWPLLMVQVLQAKTKLVEDRADEDFQTAKKAIDENKKLSAGDIKRMTLEAQHKRSETLKPSFNEAAGEFRKLMQALEEDRKNLVEKLWCFQLFAQQLAKSTGKPESAIHEDGAKRMSSALYYRCKLELERFPGWGPLGVFRFAESAAAEYDWLKSVTFEDVFDPLDVNGSVYLKTNFKKQPGAESLHGKDCPGAGPISKSPTELAKDKPSAVKCQKITIKYDPNKIKPGEQSKEPILVRSPQGCESKETPTFHLLNTPRLAGEMEIKLQPKYGLVMAKKPGVIAVGVSEGKMNDLTTITVTRGGDCTHLIPVSSAVSFSVTRGSVIYELYEEELVTELYGTAEGEADALCKPPEGEIHYKSDDSGVVFFESESKGNVKAVGLGTTTVRVTKGTITGILEVTVTGVSCKDIVPYLLLVTDQGFINTSAISVGEHFQVSADYKPPNCTPPPGDPQFTSDNSEMLRVDSNNPVTATALSTGATGETKVRVKHGGLEGERPVQVKAKCELRLALSHSSVNIGESARIYETVEPKGCSFPPGFNLRLDPEPSKVAILDLRETWFVMGTGEGKTEIVAEAPGVKSARASLTVKPYCTQAHLQFTPDSIAIGETTQATLTFTPEGCGIREAPNNSPFYRTEGLDSNVVKWDSSGKFTGREAGKVTIVSYQATYSARAILTVRPPPDPPECERIFLEYPRPFVVMGETSDEPKLSFSPPACKEPERVQVTAGLEYDAYFQGSPPDRATVNRFNGKVTGVAAGEFAVTATIGKLTSNSAFVNIIRPRCTSMAVIYSPSTIDLPSGTSSPDAPDYSPAGCDPPDEKPVYSLDEKDKDIATVDPVTGVVKGKKPGSVNINIYKGNLHTFWTVHIRQRQ